MKYRVKLTAEAYEIVMQLRTERAGSGPEIFDTAEEAQAWIDAQRGRFHTWDRDVKATIERGSQHLGDQHSVIWTPM